MTPAARTLVRMGPCRRCALLRPPPERRPAGRPWKRITATRRRVYHPTRGPQFKAHLLRSSAPSSTEGASALGHDPRHRRGLRAQAGAGVQRHDARRHRDRAPSGAARSPASARSAVEVISREPLPARAGHPRDRVQARRHDRDEAGRRQDGGRPGMCPASATRSTRRRRRDTADCPSTSSARWRPSCSKSTNLVRTVLDLERVVCGRRENPTSRLRTCSTETLHRRAGRRRTPDRRPASAEPGSARVLA